MGISQIQLRVQSHDLRPLVRATEPNDTQKRPVREPDYSLNSEDHPRPVGISIQMTQL